MASTDFKGLSILKTTDIVDVMKQSATENCISKSGNVGTITFTNHSRCKYCQRQLC